MKIIENRLLEFRPAAAGIDILDAQQKSPTSFLRRAVRHDRGVGMSQMQKSRWTWRKSGDNHGLLHHRNFT